jgi:hypothetical protein
MHAICELACRSQHHCGEMLTACRGGHIWLVRVVLGRACTTERLTGLLAFVGQVPINQQITQRWRGLCLLLASPVVAAIGSERTVRA